MKKADLKFLGLGLVFILAACRSGHFEEPAVQVIPAKPTPGPSSPMVPIETFSVLPVDLTTVKQKEVSAQVLEYGLEQVYLISSSQDPSSKPRKVFYSVNFENDSNRPPAQGSVMTENGVARIPFSLFHSPFENEIIQTVRVSLKFSADAAAEKIEKLFWVDFDRDLLKPLVSYFSPPAILQATGAQRIQIHLNLAENKNRELLQLDSRLHLHRTPSVEGELTLFLSRKRLNSQPDELKLLSKKRMRAKVLVLKKTLARTEEVSSERILDLVTDENAQVPIHLQANRQDLEGTTEELRWIFALDLPEFPAIEKSYFIFDDLKPGPAVRWTLERLLKESPDLGKNVYELSVPSVLNKPSSVAWPKNIFSNSQDLRLAHPELESSLQDASRLENQAFWEEILRKLAVKPLDFKMAQIFQLDLVSNLKNQKFENIQNFDPASSVKIFENSEGLNGHLDLQAETDRFILFFLNSSDPALVYHLPGPKLLETKERNAYLYPKVFNLHFISLDRTVDLAQILKGFDSHFTTGADKSERGVVVRRFYP